MAKKKKIIKREDFEDRIEYLFNKIKFYSDVCEELGEYELTINDFLNIKDEKDRLQTLAFAKIKQIQRLFNEEWEAKFDGNQYNYYPYFTGSGLSLVFDCSSYSRYDISDGQVASFKTREISNFVGKTFIDIYRDIK